MTGIGWTSRAAEPPASWRPFALVCKRWFGPFARNAYTLLRGPEAKLRPTRLRSAAESLYGAGCAVLLTLCGLGLHWNLSTATVMFLLLVVLSAVRYGFWQAAVVAVAAVALQSYCFAPPAFTFYIADPQNGIALVVFAATALLVSRISTRERSHAAELERQRRSLEQMFAISRGMLLLDLQQSPVQEMAELIRAQCGAVGVAILDKGNCDNGDSDKGDGEDGDGELKIAGEWMLDRAPAALLAGAGEIAAVAGLSQRTLMVANAPLGSLLLLQGADAIDPLTMDALASLVALTLERYRAFHSERSSRAARQTEQLRTTVLDGLAHAFKTPLTIIRAASSGLLEMGELSFAQQELTLLIDSESMRLDDLATRLLQTARLDDANIALEREVISIRAVVREAAAAATRCWHEQSDGGTDTPRVEVQIEAGDGANPVCAMADYEMLKATVRELLENAAKYSFAGSPITARVCDGGSEVTVSVHNRGPMIELADRERIFERFYRCPSHRHSAPGTGIGLSMARHAIEAHHGHIWVISEEHQGTTFYFALPKGLDRADGGPESRNTRDAPHKAMSRKMKTQLTQKVGQMQGLEA